MWVLSVDTSSGAGSVVLSHDGRVLGSVETDNDESHAVRLFAAVEFLTSQLKISLSQIDAYAVTTGPGSFSGLRIGVSAVKGLAEMHRKPTIGVSTLHAIAASARLTERGQLLIPLWDARRSELFAGIYSYSGQGWTAQEEDQLFAVDAFFESQPKTPRLFVGPDVETFSSFIQPYFSVGWSMQRTSRFLGRSVARLAEPVMGGGGAVSADHLGIHYIRRSDAEILFKG